MGEYTDPHREFEEDEEEALSLCDLPLEEDNEVSKMGSHSRRSSSELFEFFSSFSSEMCSAEDIIFCGKLIPLKDLSPPPPPHPHPHPHPHHDQHQQQDKRRISFRRRSESLSGLHSSVSRSNSMMRNSRSLDYRKLERFSSKTSIESNNSMERNSSFRSNTAKRTLAKPRWYVFMFGVVKPPKEMELRDIKTRQFRRNSSNVMLPPPVADTVNKPPVGKGSCKLLKVLSCRDHNSVSVATSLCMPPPA